LDEYIEPYKAINIYHSFELPELIYFSIDATYQIYGNYQNKETAILNDIKAKLSFLFSTEKINFGHTIDFKAIEDYVYNLTISSDDNSFSNLKGMQFFKIREVYLNKDVNESNNTQLFPVYLSESIDRSNSLRAIKLGPNQYPMFVIDGCQITKD
jgi:hypothetical protein